MSTWYERARRRLGNNGRHKPLPEPATTRIGTADARSMANPAETIAPALLVVTRGVEWNRASGPEQTVTIRRADYLISVLADAQLLVDPTRARVLERARHWRAWVSQRPASSWAPEETALLQAIDWMLAAIGDRIRDRGPAKFADHP